MDELFENPEETQPIDVARERRINRAAETLLDLPKDQWRDAAIKKADGDEALGEAILKRLHYLDDHIDDDDDEIDDQLREGSVVGDCILRRLIDQGAHGSVWEAEQQRAKRRVALKLVRPDRLTASLRKRLEYESRALARLQHPGIARLFDTGEHRNARGERTPFLVMDLIQNPTPITTYATQLDLKARLEKFALIADAIHHAHARGLIHRDLKPSNIVADADGRPRVIDFGVARPAVFDPDALDEHAELDESAGTPAYMAPEQCGGKPELVDTRADIYALGAILYELITDERFLAFDPQETIIDRIRRVRDHTVPPPSKRNRAARGDLDAIVSKCLAKSPDERYDTAAQLRDDLRDHLAGKPISIRRGEFNYQLLKLANRHRARVAIGAVGIAAVAGVTAALMGSSVYAGRVRAERDLAQSARSEAVATADAFDRYVELFFDEVQINDDRAVEQIVDEALARLAADGVNIAPGPERDRARVVEAIVRTNLAESLERRARYREARRAMRDALVLLESVAETPADTERADLARQRLIQRFILDADTYAARGDQGRANALLEDALPFIRRAIERGETKGPSVELAYHYYDLAASLTALGREREAIEPLNSAKQTLSDIPRSNAEGLWQDIETLECEQHEE